MSVKIYESVKKRKPFGVYDLILYATIVLIAVGLFLGFFVFKSDDGSDGFKVVIDEKEAFVFYYETCYYEIKDSVATITVEVKDDEKGLYSVSVYLGDGKDYNVLSVNAEEKTVSITEADCSAKKDCVHTPAINGDSGAIYCMPHKLKVLPLKNGYRPIKTGGV